MLRLARGIARQLVHTVRARRRRGPLRPGWSPLYEAVTQFTRASWSRRAEVHKRRAWFEGVGRLHRQLPGITREPTRLAGLEAEWQRPEAPADDRVFLYFHGGGYHIGSIDTHRAMTEELARQTRRPVLSVNYRLAPEHHCPAPIEDVLACMEALEAWDIAPERVVLAGDSAGGGLVLAALVQLRESGRPLPGAALMISPWADLTRRPPVSEVDYILDNLWPDEAESYAGELPLDDPRVSPVLAELAGLPPMYLLAGGAETLLPDSRDVAARARAAGVDVALDIVPHEVHDFPIFSTLNPRGPRAFQRVGSWLDAHPLR